MERVAILVERPESETRIDFNRRTLDSLGPALARDAAYLSLHLVDEIAEQIPLGELTRRPAFDALFEIHTQVGLGEIARRLNEAGTLHVYRVGSRRLRNYPRDWADGTRTPGVCMISPAYRAAHRGARDFDAHWRRRHAPLALEHHIGMWDYRQNPILEVCTSGSPAFDGIAQMGFPSVEAFRSGLFDSPEGMKIIMEDTRRFLDLGRSESAMMGEYVLKS